MTDPKIIEISASSADRVRDCAGSIGASEIKIDSGTAVTAVGDAVHAVMQDVRRKDLTELPDLYPYAEIFGVDDFDDLRWVAYKTFGHWMEFAQGLEALAIEEAFRVDIEIEGGIIRFSGHPDFVGAENGEEPALIIWDDKTGYLERPCVNQVFEYAFMAFRRWPQFDQAWLIISRPRFAKLEQLPISRQDAETWAKEMIRRLGYGSFHVTDDNCDYCSKKPTCEARHLAVRGAHLDLVAPELITAELAQDMANKHSLFKVWSKAAKNWHECFKQMLTEFGPQKIEGGMEIFLAEEEIRPIILNDESVEMIMAFLHITTREALFNFLLGSLTISKKKLNDHVASRAPRGKKGKTISEFLENMDTVGGLGSTIKHVIRTRKKVEENAGDVRS